MVDVVKYANIAITELFVHVEMVSRLIQMIEHSAMISTNANERTSEFHISSFNGNRRVATFDVHVTCGRKSFTLNFTLPTFK